MLIARKSQASSSIFLWRSVPVSPSLRQTTNAAPLAPTFGWLPVPSPRQCLCCLVVPLSTELCTDPCSRFRARLQLPTNYTTDTNTKATSPQSPFRVILLLLVIILLLLLLVLLLWLLLLLSHCCCYFHCPRVDCIILVPSFVYLFYPPVVVCTLSSCCPLIITYLNTYATERLFLNCALFCAETHLRIWVKHTEASSIWWVTTTNWRNVQEKHSRYTVILRHSLIHFYLDPLWWIGWVCMAEKRGKQWYRLIIELLSGWPFNGWNKITLLLPD